MGAPESELAGVVRPRAEEEPAAALASAPTEVVLLAAAAAVGTLPLPLARNMLTSHIAAVLERLAEQKAEVEALAEVEEGRTAPDDHPGRPDFSAYYYSCRRD